MPSHHRLRHAAVAVLLLCPHGVAHATTFVLGPDEELLSQASHVAEVTVLRVAPAPYLDPPSTDYIVLVTATIKGHFDRSTIVVRLPGIVGGEAAPLRIPGVPVFREDEEALLFLLTSADGTYGVLHWAMGAFTKVWHRNRALALRHLTDAAISGDVKQRVRDYDGFVQWIARRARGESATQGYFLDDPSILDWTSTYTLLRYRGTPLRWFSFDSGGSVSWRFRQAGSGGTIGAFRSALSAWNADQATPVRLLYGGLTNSRAGLMKWDGINALIFGDPNRNLSGRYSCKSGGVLAAALPKPSLSLNKGRYEGRIYYRIQEADIVVNDGTDCYFRGRPDRAAEVLTHELGHTLGIGHSCGDDKSGSCSSFRKNDATMRATAHDDRRGAALRTDDRAALKRLYGGSSSGGPGKLHAPSNLRAWSTSSTTGRLEWRDNSTNETGFEIWSRVGNGSWHRWLTRPMNTTGVGFRDATPGKKYSFAVRATRNSQFSDYSNVASVRMPEGNQGGLSAPSNLRAWSTSSTEGRLQWRDNSREETGFDVHVKVGTLPWRAGGTFPENTTRIRFWGASPGTTYRFKVRATRGSKRSAFSNVAKVTMPWLVAHYGSIPRKEPILPRGMSLGGDSGVQVRGEQVPKPADH